MNETKNKLSGPDFVKGVSLSKVADGTMVLGHAHGEPVLLARRGDELFAIYAVQRTDGEYAVRTMRALRALFAAGHPAVS